MTHETLDAAALDRVYGGFRWEDLPESNNVEDRRFDPPGTEYPETPVPPNAYVPPDDPLANALGRNDIPQLGRRGGGAPMRGYDDELGGSDQGTDDTATYSPQTDAGSFDDPTSAQEPFAQESFGQESFENYDPES